MFETMSNRRLAATTLGLTCVLMLNSCASPERDENEEEQVLGYSELTNFCTDIEYHALEEEFGVLEPWASQEDLEGYLDEVQNPPSLHCGGRSYYTTDETFTARLNFSVYLENDYVYGLDLPEEDAPWLDPSVVYPMGVEGSPKVELTSAEQGLISKGQSEQIGQTNFDSITYAAFQSNHLGDAWDPEGAGKVIFAWYEHENLLISFWLRVTDELYDTSPDPEHLLSILNDTAEEIRKQLKYTPTEK